MKLGMSVERAWRKFEQLPRNRSFIGFCHCRVVTVVEEGLGSKIAIKVCGNRASSSEETNALERIRSFVHHPSEKYAHIGRLDEPVWPSHQDKNQGGNGKSRTCTEKAIQVVRGWSKT